MADTEVERRRVSCRLDEEDYQTLRYWAERADMTVSEYLAEAIRYKIAYDAGDYDVPNLLTQRLAQLVEADTNLAVRFESLSELVTSSMRALLALTRDDSYLLDDFEAVSDGGNQ